MPQLSKDCLDRLRDLDGQLGSIAFTIDQHGSLDGLQTQELSSSLQRASTSPHTDDDDCKDIFKGLEPKLGNLIESIDVGHPATLIRLHVASAQADLRSAGIDFN